jgi:hypothetical protein
LVYVNAGTNFYVLSESVKYDSFCQLLRPRDNITVISRASLSLHTRYDHYYFCFSKFFRLTRQTFGQQKKQSTMGKGNPHLPEKKKIAQQYLRAVYEQGGVEALNKVKPTDCWACHPAELSKGNYTVSAWGSLFGRQKKDAEQEVSSTGQLSSFPQYAAENIPDCFKMAGASGGAGGGGGEAAAAGVGGCSGANGSPSGAASKTNNGKFFIQRKGFSAAWCAA